MKVRNNKVLRIIGSKTLAGVLALGLGLGAPVSALAEEGWAEEVTEENVGDASGEVPEDMSQEEVSEEVRPQARLVDGSGTLVDVSDEVWALIQEGSLALNEESLFLEDLSTGQKVDPTTGKRVDENTDQKKDTDASQNEDETVKAETEEAETATEEVGAAAEDAAEDEGEAEETEESENQDSVDSNEALIANQQIVKAPEIIEDFRFWTVARKYAFAKAEIAIRESIPENVAGSDTTSDELAKEAAKKEAENIKTSYEEASKKGKTSQTSAATTDLLSKAVEENASLDVAGQESSEQVRAVGKLSKDGLLYILKEEDNG